MKKERRGVPLDETGYTLFPKEIKPNETSIEVKKFYFIL
jgi:hypothetical protein